MDFASSATAVSNRSPQQPYRNSDGSGLPERAAWGSDYEAVVSACRGQSVVVGEHLIGVDQQRCGKVYRVEASQHGRRNATGNADDVVGDPSLRDA